MAIALVAGLVSFFVSTASSGAVPTLSLGSQWNAEDGVVDTTGVVDIPDPSGHADTSNYNEGASEDTICPAVQAGTAANKDDVDHVYFGAQATATTVFTYMAWHRIATNGTTTIDFELNHSGQLKSNCNGFNTARQADDILVTYDFQGSGPFTIDISFSRWVGNANAGTWVPAAPPLSLTAHKESISADGAFGELVMDLDAAGVLTKERCDTFSSFFVKTRSSSQNFSNTIKDFIPPQTAHISNCGSVNIHKQDDNGAALQGVQFDLYTDVNGVQGVPVVPAQSCTTNASGNCSINDIEIGTYWVVEHSVPAGYTGAAAQKVTVTANSTASLTFVNPRKPAAVNIVKKDDTGAALQGATFTLYSGTTSTGKTCTTGADGKCSITNILPPGTYTVKETTTPAGYTTADDQTVTLGLDQTVTLTFVDTRKPATVNVVKKDDTGAALADAGFTLYTDSSGAPGSAVSGKTCTTGADGKCSITNILPPGTYWVVETTTPTGYTTADPQSVTLGLDQTVTVTFTDDRQPARVDITKTDDNGAALSGAAFGLYTDDNGAPGSAVSGKTCTTGANGKCSITSILPAGTYWVVETTTPTGYSTADPQKVTLALNQTVGLTFVDPRQPARVDIVKKDDAGAALSGAGFSLYTDDDGEPGSAVSNKTCTTGSAGTCSITNILPPATYWVVETTTPTGYETADPQSVTLGLNQTVTLHFTDPRKPASIDIVKVDDSEHALAGAQFSLYSDGEPVSGKVCTTGVDGKCTIGGILPPGTYTVKETVTPPGYKTAADQTVTLSLDEHVTLTFIDPVKSLGISLVKKVNGEHSTEADPLLVESGTTVTYTVTVTNTGELPLTITALADTLNADLPGDCAQGLQSTLEVGGHFDCTYTSSITDPAHNVASVTGKDVLNRTTSAHDEVFVEPINPAIGLSKTGPSAAHVGDTVTYTFTVGNLGDTPLADITLTDDRCAADPVITSKVGGNDDAVLDLDETWTYTCQYTVTTADAGSVVNTAQVAGTDVLETTVKATDDYTFPVLHPAITLDKTANPVNITSSGPVTYTYVVTNNGDTTLFNIAVTDDVIGAIGTIASLAPGQSQTLTRTVTVNTSTKPTNIGTATGADVLGKSVSDTDDATISVVLAEVIEKPKPTLPKTGLMLLRETWWALVLIGLGSVLVVTTRRRRSATGTAADS